MSQPERLRVTRTEQQDDWHQREIERICEWLERVEKDVRDEAAKCEARFALIDERVRKLREWQAWVLGAVAAVSALLAIAGTVVAIWKSFT